MQNQLKIDAAVHGEKGPEGAREKYLRGHNAVDPHGHICLVPGNDELPGDGWRWATADDLSAAAAAEKQRAEREASEKERALAKARAAGEKQDKERRKGGPLRK